MESCRKASQVHLTATVVRSQSQVSTHEGLGGLLTIIFGTSRETSDFLTDCLQQWWNLSKNHSLPIRQLVIDLDNGPQHASVRTQFMQRMVEFADRNAVEVVLVSYPPYHSKYNPIERCWGILEEHWNGTLLETVDTVLPWARTVITVV